MKKYNTNHKSMISVLLSLLTILSIQITSYADITVVSERTAEVRDAIVTAAGVNSTEEVTETHLAAITVLNLRNTGISELKSGDFSGMTGLTSLNLYNNELSSLPDGIFEGLTALTQLRLGSNVIDPMPILISLEKVGIDQFKVIVPTGAPFDIVVPYSITNGSIFGNATTLTISKGSRDSDTLRVSHITDTTDDIQIGIGETLPNLPLYHFGYVLTKSDAIRLQLSEDGNSAPIFTDGLSTTRTVAENLAIGTDIGTAISATDANEDTLTYTLSGTDAATFDIVTTTGQLKTKTILDYETKSTYSVVINVTDGSLTDTIIATIAVTDIDETVSNTAPEFVNGNLTSRTVPENTVAGVYIGTPIAATDADNDTLTYSLSGTDAADFEIQKTTGQLITKAALDYETKTEHTVTVTVTDGMSMDEISVVITITDVTDTVVISASVPVSDRTTEVQDAIVNAISDVSSADGVTDTHLADITTLDLSDSDISALQQGDFDGMTALTSLDLSDNELSSLPIGIFEGLTALTTLDLSGNTIDPIQINVTLQKVDENKFKAIVPTAAPFVIVLPINIENGNIDGTTNSITIPIGGTESGSLTVNRTLETTAIVSADISALPSLPTTHTGYTLAKSTELPLEVISRINITPVFTEGTSTSRSVSEEEAASVNIGDPVVATDSDNDTLTYTFEGPDAASFDIDSETGQLRTKDALNYETKSSYMLTVSVDDANGGIAAIDVRIDVIDKNEAPMFTEGTLTTRMIEENSASGFLIGSSVSASDADNNTLTYTLSGTDAESFDIDPDTGQLKVKSVLDYETKRVYSVVVSVSDGSIEDTIIVIIGVIDLDDTPFDVSFVPVNERTPQVRDVIIDAVPNITEADDVTAAHLTTINALDLQSVNISELKTGDFYGMTGLTTLNLSNNLLTTVPFGIFHGLTTLTQLNLDNNFADPIPLTLSIQQVSITQFQAVISAGAPFDLVLPINVTDGSLRDGTTITIPQGSMKSVTFTVESTGDPIVDIGALPAIPTNHLGYVLSKSTTCNRTQQIREAIVAALPGITDCNNVTEIQLATINSLNLTSTSITSLSSHDFDGMYSLTTLYLSNNQLTSLPDDVFDNLQMLSELHLNNNQLSSLPDGIFDGLTSLEALNLSGNTADTLQFTVSLQKVGVNQFKAVVPIGAPFEIVLPISVENGSVGSAVAIVIPIGSVESQPLTVTRLPGTSAAVTVNFGTLPTPPSLHSGYALVKTDTLPLEIFSKINAPPIFAEEETTTRTVTENTEIGENIGTAVAATDTDTDTLIYTLSGTDADAFSIDSSSGQLKNEVSFDYEVKVSYSVTVAVADGNGGTDTISVTINVRDISENSAPTFTDGDTTERTVAENTESGVNIDPAVSASDAEEDTLTYTLSGNDAETFTIDEETGQLQTNASLDYETKASYMVNIMVSDAEFSDTIDVTINVTNVNEVPIFSEGESATRSVKEDAALGSNVGTAIVATDVDADTTLTYSLSEDNDTDAFEIDSDTGQLKTKTTLDYETKATYTINVAVFDGDLYGSIDVTINVTFVNNAPVFTEGDSATRSIAEHTDTDINIGEPVTATDEDEDTLIYSLIGADANNFTFNSETGQLQTNGPLDYEEKASYTVKINVSDGELTDTIDVEINLTDINDAPIFLEGDSTTRSIPEDADSDQLVGSVVSATDVDGDSLTYSLSGTHVDLFSVDDSTGQLSTSGQPDFDSNDVYSVTITVTDGELNDTIQVTINISDVNDAPTFRDGSSATRSIDENSSSGVAIGNPITATDIDSSTLVYSLGGTDAGSFSFDRSTGQLRTSAPLNYETKNTYSVSVTVSDGELTHTIGVTINIDNVNEAPTFPTDSGIRYVNENTASGVAFDSPVSATDVDTGTTLIYSLTGSKAGVFSIDSNTGQLQTNEPLDYEETEYYFLGVDVSDGSLSDSIRLRIDVGDINDAPVFSEGEDTTRTIDENTTSGVNIGTPVEATDEDTNFFDNGVPDTLEYSLGGTDAASFNIDNRTGQLRTNAPLDHETKETYAVTITVSDTAAEGALTDTIPVTITIGDVNEAPVFNDGEDTTRSVDENTAANQNIGTAVAATDEDADAILVYTLSGTDAAVFDIDGTTGQLLTNAPLNFELESTYDVTITVTDNGSLTDTIPVTIEINDVNDAPVFIDGEDTTRDVDENTAANQNIGTVVAATDEDTDATLTYTLGGTDAAAFEINGTTGQLLTKDELNFEVTSTYAVTITVTDNGSLTDTIPVTIEINDVNEAPVFTDGEDTTRDVDENTAANQNIGTVVAATDEDTNATLTYSLEGTDAATFDIETTSGQLKTKNALDHETDDSYSVTIKVTDNGNLTDTIDVTININDVNEAPTFATTTTARSIPENTEAGVNIEDVVDATDVDENDTLTYSLGGDDVASFDIVETTGQIQTKAALNYEDKNVYLVTVTATDRGNLTDSITVTINITDVNDAPVFTDGEDTTRAIDENTAANQNIGTVVAATDEDTNATLTYSLEGTNAATFDIETTSGQLKTKNALDHETDDSYSVTIKVTDNGNLTDTIDVTININDVNEAPTFATTTTARSIPENTEAGVDIETAITATEVDDGDTLTYSIEGADAASFDIVETTGQLQTKNELDHESDPSYTVTVKVTDSGNLTDTISVTINITDVEESPEFENESVTLTVDENTDAGTNIGSAITASDDDGDTITYSFGGTDADDFTFDTTTAQLKTKTIFDYENDGKTSYSVTITATDDSADTLSSAITVIINIDDVEEAPVFENESVTLTVDENTAAGTNIGSAITASDDDGDTISYSVGGTDADDFTFDTTTAQLKTKTIFDYEDDVKTSYSVSITATDDSADTLSNAITVIINISDVGEAPVFENESVTLTVDENTAAGTNIGSAITASDDDGDTISYSVGGTDADDFTFDTTTAQLKTKSIFDYEDDVKTSYSVSITATDDSADTLSSAITVIININDVEEAPIFENESVTLTVDENTAAGTNIGSAITASDDDGDTISYSFGGTDADDFTFDTTTAQLKTKTIFDYEDDVKTSYSVSITATDDSADTLSSAITVIININDVEEAPIFENESVTLTVDENTAAGTNIGSAITASDDDGDTISYSFGGTDADDFTFDTTTAQLKTKTIFDYEDDVKTSYSVSITATDDSADTLSSAITVIININDVGEAPVFENESVTLTVDENTAAGTNIGSAITATDDDGDTITYTFGGTDADDFTFDTTAAQLKTKTIFDFEDDVKTSYSVSITATDDSADTLSSAITVIININDVNEAPIFSDPTANRSIDLTAAGVDVGSTIGNPVTASDDDGDSLTYSISGTGSDKFDIDSSSGQLKVTQNLIDDTASSYTITVTAKDADLATDTIDVTISVTRTAMEQNVAPVFTDGENTTRAIDENTAANQNIGTPIAATDQNSGDTLTYALSGTDATKFDFDTNSGQLKTKDSLNYEDDNSHAVTITVSDGNNGSDSIEVTINVNDANDAPQFTEGTTATRNVRDDTASGINIGDAVSATDEDNDTLAYSLDGTDASSFSIVTTTGQLQTSSTLDHETQSEYSVTVSADDGNMGTTSIDVTINVISSDTFLTPISDRSDRMKVTLRKAVRELLGDDTISNSDITIAHLQQITSILIDDNRNKGQLQSGDFDDLPALTSLYLNNRGLNDSSIPADIFDGLSALTTLDMSFNEFSNLPSGIFDGLSALTDLDLSNNDFSSLPSGIFAGLSALTDLDLSANAATSLPSGVFDGLSALTDLIIHNNDFSSLPSGIFAGLSALTTLDMQYNDFTSLPSGFFNGLSSLRTLYISYCLDLTSVDVNLFEDLSELITLNMNNSPISSLPEDLFDNTPKLETLNLSNLPISTLPSDIFDGLSELNNLTLSYSTDNSLTSLPGDIFDGLSKLEQLRLNNNGFASLPDGIFKGLTSLIVFEVGDQRPDTNVMDLIDMDINFSLIDEGDGTFKIEVHTGAPATARAVVNVENGTIDGDTRKTYNIPAGSVESDSISVTRTDGTTDAVTVRMGRISLPGKTNAFGGYQLVKLTATPLEIYAAELGAPTVVSKSASPTITMFLPNFPNPFNPETWLPYQLATPGDVTLTFYDMRGVVIRKLALGHQPAGYYTSRNRAAYWDGRNNIGEMVAAGVYFCTFKAGDYTETRKMLIRK